MTNNENQSEQQCILVSVLRNLSHINRLSLLQWDLLVRQARRADLLGRLAVLLSQDDRLQSVPQQPRAHLTAALAHVEKHKLVLQWEIQKIQEALTPLNIPIVFLKGAAYVLRGLPPMRGRVYADVDIMVPKQDLGKVEKALRIHGWQETKLNAYDQAYYRKWMHEIPPLRHRQRQTVIDVHHRILPETTMAQPDPVRMLEQAEPVDALEHAYTLSPIDMVIHSATHLFYEGEFDHGLRDLVDLDDLFRHFGEEPEFWQNLVDRANELQLSIPIYYSIRYCERILNTPIPPGIQDLKTFWRPKSFRRKMMDYLFEQALMPLHVSCYGPGSDMARKMLYIRSHYLRMPLYLLIPHLLRKTFRNEQEG